METKVLFSIRNHHKRLSQLFLIHSNTYVMGLCHYKYFISSNEIEINKNVLIVK